MWEKLYTSSRPTQTSTYFSRRENIQIPSLPNKIVRKGNLISYQRVRTSDLALNRKKKASEAQLSPKRINLPKETQQPTNLKWKITHQESVTPSKHPRLENIIDPGDDEQFSKDIKKIHESKDQAHIEFSEELWREDEQLKQLYKTHMNQIKDLDIQGHSTRTYPRYLNDRQGSLVDNMETHQRNLPSSKLCF